VDNSIYLDRDFIVIGYIHTDIEPNVLSNGSYNDDKFRVALYGFLQLILLKQHFRNIFQYTFNY